MTEYNRRLRKNDFEFIRKKRESLFNLLDDNEHSPVLKWYWIGRNLQMIQSTINESFTAGNLTNYQYHIAFRWSHMLERYVNGKMAEVM